MSKLAPVKLAAIAATAAALFGLVGVAAQSSHPATPTASPCCKILF